MKVLLTEPAKQALDYLLSLGVTEDIALLITQDSQSDWMTAKIFQREQIKTLKKELLGQVYSGIPVYLFGVENPAFTQLELTPDWHSVLTSLQDKLKIESSAKPHLSFQVSALK